MQWPEGQSFFIIRKIGNWKTEKVYKYRNSLYQTKLKIHQFFFDNIKLDLILKSSLKPLNFSGRLIVQCTLVTFKIKKHKKKSFKNVKAPFVFN